MIDPAILSLIGVIAKYIAFWCLFWTIVNNVLPPRETFSDFPSFLRWYNLLLKLVAFWGALNLRSFTVKMYSSVTNAEAPVAKPEDK